MQVASHESLPKGINPTFSYRASMENNMKHKKKSTEPTKYYEILVSILKPIP
jgi:hypothetical protein